jgi:hypothetical protein
MSQHKRVAAILLFVLLGGVLVLATAAGKKHREVEIDRDSCKVDAQAINVSKPKQQDVHWVIDQDAIDSDTFTVKFDKQEGSPCADKDSASPPRIEFKVTGEQKSDSCRLHPKAVVYKEYRYSIYRADGTKCNDPSVIVQNGREGGKPPTKKKP